MSGSSTGGVRACFVTLLGTNSCKVRVVVCTLRMISQVRRRKESKGMGRYKHKSIVSHSYPRMAGKSGISACAKSDIVNERVVKRFAQLLIQILPRLLEEYREQIDKAATSRKNEGVGGAVFDE